MNKKVMFATVNQVKDYELVDEAISKNFMRKLIHEGVMPGYYAGNKFMIHIPKFLEMLENSNSGNYVQGGRKNDY